MGPAWPRAGASRIGRQAPIAHHNGGPRTPASTDFRRGRVDFRRCRARARGGYALIMWRPRKFWAERPVPASLMASVDDLAQPAPVGPRTGRDWVVDVIAFLLAVALGALTLGSDMHDGVAPF